MKNIAVLGETPDVDTAIVDLFVCAAGYEARSSYLARRMGGRYRQAIALAFDFQPVASFEDNIAFFRSNSFDIFNFDSNSLTESLSGSIDKLLNSDVSAIKIAVDISSMSRPMIALVLTALRDYTSATYLDVYFYYCPAVFVPPTLGNAPVTVSEPVIPEFAGWSSFPGNPVSAIVGLGYEFDRALGTLELLEPAIAWGFLPFGEDVRYDKAVQEANRDISQILAREYLNRYRVDQPFQCFEVIEGLTYSLLDDTRPLLLPFGPKIFALICMLVAIIHSPNVTVWRVSGESATTPVDRDANGKVVGLHVRFANERDKTH